MKMMENSGKENGRSVGETLRPFVLRLSGSPSPVGRKGNVMSKYTTVEIHPAMRSVLERLLPRALTTYPEARTRIEAGYKLASNGHVYTLPGTGSYRVVGSNLNAAYVFLPKSGCTCPDATHRAPNGRCKHVWAIAFIKRATKALVRTSETPAYYMADNVKCGNRGIVDAQKAKDGDLIDLICNRR